MATVEQVSDKMEQKLREQSLTIVEQANAITITDQDSYDHAAQVLLDVKTFRAKWKGYWEPLRDTAYSAYKKILEKINERDDPAEQAEKVLKRKIATWDEEQERIRQEQQRKAQEEVEAAEREERLKQAVEAEQSGAAPEQVEEILSAPPQAVAPVIAPTYQRNSSISRRANWKARVTDMKALCRAIAQGKVPKEYVLPNESALNARAKADGSTLNIPGVVAFNDSIISGRTR